MKFALTLAGVVVITYVSAQGSRPIINGPLSIVEAVQLAQQHNPSVVAARSQLEASAAGVRSARAAFAPQLSANSFATSSSYSSIVSSSPGVMPPYWLTVPQRGFLDQNLMMMLPLFTGGRLQAAVASANWQRSAAEAELAEMQAEVSLKVQDAYLRALVAKQM